MIAWLGSVEDGSRFQLGGGVVEIPSVGEGRNRPVHLCSPLGCKNGGRGTFATSFMPTLISLWALVMPHLVHSSDCMLCFLIV